jgi:hypothetical protein
VDIILVRTETLSLSSVKARLSELVDLDGLEETLAVMSDPALLAQVRESEQGSTLAELRKALGDLRRLGATAVLPDVPCERHRNLDSEFSSA